MEGFARYENYKDSGVPWLEKIPSHWQLRKSKYLWREVEDRSESGNERLLSVSQYSGITPRDEDSRSESLVDYKQCKPDDLIVNIMLAWLGALGISQHEGIVSPAYCVYRQTADHYSKFLGYLYGTPVYLAEFARRSKGVVPSRWRMYTEDFGQILTLIPPFSEQHRIAAFLDQKAAEIDEAIDKKQRLIELLQEQKAILINQAVTKGLNPNVPMRDSGVKWIGEIPKHWEVLRFKFVAEKIVDCLHATPKYSENGEFPAIRTADISPGIVHLSSARRIESGEYTRWIERLEPKPGDILYSREGERFGIAACVPEGAHLCISQRMMVFRIRPEYNPVFVMWLLNSKQVYAQACQDVMGSTAPHVNISTIRNYFLALPAREEQDSLVAEIENSTKGFSSAIANAASEISLFREYRSCLIADVVTGKLDVREAAIRLPDELDKSELRGVGEETEAVKKSEN